MANKIVLVVRFRATPGMKASFLDRLNQLVRPVLASIISIVAASPMRAPQRTPCAR